MKTACLALLIFAAVVGTALAADDGPRPATPVEGTTRFASSVSAATAERPRHLSKRCRRSRRHNHRRHGFTPTPPRCPRDPSADLIKVRKPRHMKPRMVDGPFPNVKPGPHDEEGDVDAERRLPLVPGPYIPHQHERLDPAPPISEESPPEQQQGRPSAQASVVGDIAVVRNRTIRSAMASPTDLDTTDGGESSVATNGKVVFFTSNDGDGLSTDGGYSFSFIDPATAFGATAGGYCCDQVVTYIPRRKRWVWVIQYWPGTGGTYNKYSGNLIRVATATTAQLIASRGTQWAVYDFRPEDFGLRRSAIGKRYTPNLDRPHVAFTRSGLQLTVSAYSSSQKTAAFFGTVLWRIPVSGLGQGFQYRWARIDEDQLTKVRPAQGAFTKTFAPTTQWFAGSTTTSRLDVFEWPDGDDQIHVHEVDVPAIAREDSSSNDPSGADWMSRFGRQAGEVETGAQVGNTLVFGWMAGRKADVVLPIVGKVKSVPIHDQPALDFAVLNIGQRPIKRVAGESVEFDKYAAALPQLRASKSGALGLNLIWGGPSRYPSEGVSFLIGWANALAVSGQRTSLVGGSDDYLGLAVDPSQPNCFVATGSASKLGVAGTSLPNDFEDPHYVVFGRRSAGCTVPLVVVFPPPPPDAAPDLVVDSIGGGFGAITITVRNAGDARANSSTLRYSLNGGPVTDATVPALDPGQSDTTVVDCRRIGGMINVVAQADATNEIAEHNEDNNANTATINCITG